ncbi:MAG: histidine kinase [Chloroflexota bacterium]|nr:histidine kinase [Chloroflexota bacterium]
MDESNSQQTLWIYLLYRWVTWEVTLIVTFIGGARDLRAPFAARIPWLLALTCAVNLTLTLGFERYVRLARRRPWVLAGDVIFCATVYGLSGSWYSPFEMYAYAALMLPAAIHLYRGGLLAAIGYFLIGQTFLWNQGYTPRAMWQWNIFRFYLANQLVPFFVGLILAYPHQLYEQLRATRQQLDEAQKGEIVRRERERIAAGLHDTAAQKVFGIGLRARRVLDRLPGNSPLRAEVAAIVELAGQGGSAIRQAIFALSGAARSDLTTSLDTLCREFQVRSGVAVQLTVRGDVGALSPEIGVVLNRVCQEALRNVEKHARARSVVVGLSTDANRAVLAVQDDGVGLPAGFSPDAGQAADPHFGLRSLRRQVEEVGGSFSVFTNDDGGVTVRAVVPFAPEPEEEGVI